MNCEPSIRNSDFSGLADHVFFYFLPAVREPYIGKTDMAQFFIKIYLYFSKKRPKWPNNEIFLKLKKPVISFCRKGSEEMKNKY